MKVKAPFRIEWTRGDKRVLTLRFFHAFGFIYNAAGKCCGLLHYSARQIVGNV